MSISKKIGTVFKGLILSYAATGMLLVLLAFFVYKYKLTEVVADLSIIIIYVLVTFLGAFFVGKKIQYKKYFWGFLLGALYITIISVVGMLLGNILSVESTVSISTVALCVGGGILGGMVS